MTHAPKTKEAKQAKVGKVMGEFKRGALRSGSKSGPKVTNPAQAKAIAMSESGQAKPSNPQQAVPPAMGQAPPMGGGETQGAVDRSSHFKGNPGFAEGRHEKNQDYHAEQREHVGEHANGPKTPDIPHAPQPQGHPIGVPPLGTNQQGKFGAPSTFRGMRGDPTPSSGHPKAHRIGKR